jgi:hypothetical protein
MQTGGRAMAKRTRKTGSGRNGKRGSRSNKNTTSHRPPERQHTIQVGTRKFADRPTTLAGRTIDILPDMPDIRDRIYQPHLRALHPAVYPRIAFTVRDQGQDASCTGFSLAHVIDFLRFREVGPDKPQPVSARMLYEMAKRNDEWEGSAYEGSSIRGAIKGLYSNGVCSKATAPDDSKAEWVLTYEMAKQARETRLGAYLRLEPDISDYHAAINDVGVIYASAQIHSNWAEPKVGRIEAGGKRTGGHAFAIVGYDAEGFWVVYSWGSTWGLDGVAHWSYPDWAATIMDAWVLQLGVRAPAAFGAAPSRTPSGATGLFGFGGPGRGDIIGHFINIDDGRLVTTGKYSSPSAQEMQQTVDRLVSPEANEGDGYDHLIIYAHGGLNSLAAEAQRIATWKRHEIFSRNRLYNFHLMWGSGFIDEVFGRLSKSQVAGRTGGRFSDWLFEAGAGQQVGSYAWRNMKQDAKAAFGRDPEYDGGLTGLLPLLSGLDKAQKRLKLHLLGHSAGSNILGYLLSSLDRFNLRKLELASIHLMAPACTVDFFNQHYRPYLVGNGALKLADKIYLYNLTDAAEFADTVSADFPLLPSYSHSLLYLVSRAYEDAPKTPLAGMQFYAGGLSSGSKIDIAYAATDSSITASRSHGGFDNDAATLATVMSRILGKPVLHPPTPDELTGY